MRYGLLFLSAALCCWIGGAAAQEKNTPDIAQCEEMLVRAETEPDATVYDSCGFNDELRAWNTWAPFASSRQLKIALFELCHRYPEHTYHELYCDKSAQLDYAPALMEMGFIKLKADDVPAAQQYFTRALKTGNLTAEDSGRISAALGLLYTTENSPYYQPEVGLALLSTAATARSAEANNALGYYYFAGKHGLKQNMQEALTSFWRAILLGCPAAEENLGAFHLARQNKVTEADALNYIRPQALTCQPAAKKAVPAPTFRPNCPCDEIRRQDSVFKSKKYLYITYLPEEVGAVVRDLQGKEYPVKVGTFLPDGSFVSEIHPRALALQRDNTRILLNRYHTGECVTYCLQPQKITPPSVHIMPYRLQFTPQECADITYYAEHLVDTSLPYTGKEECAPPDPQKTIELDEATQLLLGGLEPPTAEADDNSAPLQK